MVQHRDKRVIISGGGTGGHIFPAISVANALRRIEPGIDILFVGAEGRMEMEKVPASGYRIIGLPVSGFYRKICLRNIGVLFRLFRSLTLASAIIRDFHPDVVVGVGGYASGPVLRKAGKMGIPTLIQEQNSYAGITNRLLAKKASVICVAWDGMEKYFPAHKIIKTGNPVRHNYEDMDNLKDEALEFFGLRKGKQVVLVLGGSLGAATINKSIKTSLEKIYGSGLQLLWQTGQYYYDDIKTFIPSGYTEIIKVHGFINRMDYAFAAADVIISRAGAGTISELCLVGKPVILVPSPNVAENHQTRNAEALSERNAAILVGNGEAVTTLVDKVIKLAYDPVQKSLLSGNIRKMADRDADIKIAEEILKLAEL